MAKQAHREAHSSRGGDVGQTAQVKTAPRGEAIGVRIRRYMPEGPNAGKKTRRERWTENYDKPHSDLSGLKEMLSYDFLEKHIWEKAYISDTKLQYPEERLLFALLVDGLSGYSEGRRDDTNWLREDDDNNFTGFNNCWWVTFRSDPLVAKKCILAMPVWQFRHLLKRKFRINHTTA